MRPSARRSMCGVCLAGRIAWAGLYGVSGLRGVRPDAAPVSRSGPNGGRRPRDCTGRPGGALARSHFTAGCAQYACMPGRGMRERCQGR